MGFFANLTAKLGIDTSQFNNGLRAASAAVTRFSKQTAKDFRSTSKSAASASDSFRILGRASDKGYKSVRRITQGIIVSQAFYRTIHAIQDATEALYNFSQAVEENRIAFAGLIRDADKAKRLNETLQDLAADTPYTYEQAVDNARMLLAYEFPLQSMERIMRDIADATAASGKIESYKNIAAALGQIQGKGRVTARELIRFATAGIPVYQILREEIGLTHEQIVNLGKLRIPADVAIPAILRGMEKRYAGAAAAMQRTTKGLTNAIRENILIISQNVFDPLYQNLRVNMEKLSNRLEAMREDVRKGGFGYMLANMFPPEIVQKIQLFAANIQMFIQNIAVLYKALAPVGRAFTELFINTFNAIMPFINMFTRVLAILMQMLTSSSTAVRIFVSALGGLFIINAVIKPILGFTKALKSLLIVKLVAQGIIYLGKAIGYLTTALATNPLAAFVGLAVGGLLTMTLVSKKFGSAVDGLMGKVSGAFGVDPSKIFVPKMEENTKIADEFNKELELSSEGLEKMGNKAKEAGRKAKQALMTFDEVFVLPDPDAGAEGLDDILDISDIIEAPTIPPFDYSEMFPDVGASITEWTQGIADSTRDKLTKAIAGAGIGAAIGGVIGGIFGGLPGAVLGAKIGAAAGAIAGLFWEKLIEFFKSPTGIGASIGAIIGGIIGGPIGAVVGAILGGVAGGIVGRFWEDLKKAFENSTVRGATLGAAIGALIGFTIGGPLGAGIGAVIGGGLGAVVGRFWDDLEAAFKSSTVRGATLGATLGTLIGYAIGGPLGAAIGAVIGAGLGAVVSRFWGDLENAFTTNNSHERIAEKVAASFSNIFEKAESSIRVKVNDILDLYTELGERSYEKLYGFYLTNAKLIEESWSDLKEITREAQQEFLDLLDTHKQKELKLIVKAHQAGIITEQSNADELTQVIINKYDERAEATETAFEKINSIIETSYNDHKTLTSEALEEIRGIYVQLNEDIIGEAIEHNAKWLGIEAVAYRNLAKLDNVELDARLKRVQSMFEEEKIELEKNNQEKLELVNALYAAQLISADEYKNQIQNIWDEYEEAYSALEKREAEITEDILSHKKSILDKTIEWVENTKKEYEDWKNSVSESFSTWKKETYGDITDWYNDTKDKLSTWWSDTKTGFNEWKNDTFTNVSEWYSDTKGKFSDWWDETNVGFSDWWEDSKTGFLTWAEDVYDNVVGWFDKLRKKLENFFEDLKFWKKKAKDEVSSIASTRSSGGTVGSYSMDPVTIGHAKGGVFNKEHIAKINEGNKIEAILPVENPSAMAKVRQAIFGGEPIEMFNRLVNDIISTQPSPIIYGGNQQPTPVYVGTLIADERGLRELERKLYDIRIAERHRRGE
jgi:tape measure domain-containing protein